MVLCSCAALVQRCVHTTNTVSDAHIAPCLCVAFCLPIHFPWCVKCWIISCLISLGHGQSPLHWQVMEPRTSRRLKERRRWEDKATRGETRRRERESKGRGGKETERQTKPEREKWGEEPDRGVDREMEQLKRGRQLGPARTEQLLRPISSSTRPRCSLA